MASSLFPKQYDVLEEEEREEGEKEENENWRKDQGVQKMKKRQELKEERVEELIKSFIAEGRRKATFISTMEHLQNLYIFFRKVVKLGT